MTRKGKPRILHVVTSTARRGAESFGVSLDEELAARGYCSQVVALMAAPRGPQHAIPNLGSQALHPRTLGRLRALASRFDVVVAHGSRTLPASVLALAGRVTPIVYVNIGDPRFWAATRFRHLRVRTLLGRVKAVAALTESSRQILIEDFRVESEKVRVIPNGRHALQFPLTDSSRRSAARVQVGLPRDGNVVLYLGALTAEKRPDVAIDAVAGMQGAVTLVIAGDGALRQDVLQHASSALGQRGKVVGSRSDVANILAAADVLVLPSDSEGLPGVLIEAGLTGLPVVATDVGFVSEVVIDGVTGVLVPPRDVAAMIKGIERALTHRDDLGAAARRHCLAKFEFASIVNSWESLLHDVSV